jgi:hypothetical protein
MITNLTNWINSNETCILVEVGFINPPSTVQGTLYLSNRAYITGGGESPANTAYLPILTDDLAITEQMSVEFKASMSFGGVEIVNADGVYDSWLNYEFANRPIKVFLGSPSWPRNQFVQVFSGICDRIAPRGRHHLRWSVKDTLQRLNVPISEVVLNDVNIPVAFGEVSNVKPLLVNPATLTYQAHTRSVGSIIEVRDGGIPVQFAPHTNLGQFNLLSPAISDLTCSVHGDNVHLYKWTAADIIKALATEFGPVSTRFTSSEIDQTNFTAHAQRFPEVHGYYSGDRDNLLAACVLLSSSVHTALTVSKLGQLRLIPLDLDNVGIVDTITPADILEDTYFCSQVLDPEPTVRLAYNRNYSANGAVLAGVPSILKDILVDEWMYVRAKSPSQIEALNAYEEPAPIETTLQNRVEALGVANRRLNLFSTRRKVLTFRGVKRLLALELGDKVTIQHGRFISGGSAVGFVTQLKPNWSSGYVDIEILI